MEFGRYDAFTILPVLSLPYLRALLSPTRACVSGMLSLESRAEPVAGLYLAFPLMDFCCTCRCSRLCRMLGSWQKHTLQHQTRSNCLPWWHTS